MSEIAAFLPTIADGLFQQAYVVSDLAAAEEALRATLGCDEFADLPPTDLNFQLRGETVSCALAIGFARSGNLQIELIQPVRGQGIHAEFLAEHGPGAHHLGFLVDDLDAVVAQGEQLGFADLMGSAFGNLRFSYLDTWDALGLYVELVEDPDGLLMALKPWR